MMERDVSSSTNPNHGHVELIKPKTWSIIITKAIKHYQTTQKASTQRKEANQRGFTRIMRYGYAY